MDMIPAGITNAHIRKAMRRISREGFPTRRKSRHYCLLVNGRHFPPKYTIALSHEIATGRFLGSEEFSGGDESERFLQKRGFKVAPCCCGGYSRNAKPGTQQNTRNDDRRRAASPILRVALVFPTLKPDYRPNIPSVKKFADEDVDFVLFPEAYVDSSDRTRIKALRKLASDLGAPLLVGAGNEVDGGKQQILLRFDPDGPAPIHLYTKHSTAGKSAFEMPNWNPRDMLPTFELGGVKTGATICNDQYLGLLQRHMAKNGKMRLWLNPSYNNVLDIKWSSILRLRAVENRLFAFCTLHNDKERRPTHPFAFSPDGSELWAREAGYTDKQPISGCRKSDVIYIVEFDTASACKQLDWSSLPHATIPQRSNKNPKKPVRVSLKSGRPTIYAGNRWHDIAGNHSIQTKHGKAYVGMIRNGAILDAAACFNVIYNAHKKNSHPIIWNHWNSLPTEPDRLTNLLKGRSLECCAPVIISDKTGIHEVVELANCEKIPVRRTVSRSKAMVDLAYALGLPSALKKATKHTASAVDMYQSLAV